MIKENDKLEKAQLVVDLLKEYLDPKYKEVLNTYNPDENLNISKNPVEFSLWDEFTFVVGNDEIILDIMFSSILEVEVCNASELKKVVSFYEDHGCECWDDTIKILKEQTRYEK